MYLRCLSDPLLASGAHQAGRRHRAKLLESRSDNLRIQWLHNIIHHARPTLLPYLGSLIVR